MSDIPAFDTTTFDKTIRINLNKLKEAKELVKAIRHQKPTWKRNAFVIDLGEMKICRNILEEERVEPLYRNLTYVTQKILDLLDEAAKEIDAK